MAAIHQGGSAQDGKYADAEPELLPVPAIAMGQFHGTNIAFERNLFEMMPFAVLGLKGVNNPQGQPRNRSLVLRQRLRRRDRT